MAYQEQQDEAAGCAFLIVLALYAGVILAVVGLVLLLISCVSCGPVLRPAYLEGRPVWQKALYWAGPGH